MSGGYELVGRLSLDEVSGDGEGQADEPEHGRLVPDLLAQPPEHLAHERHRLGAVEAGDCVHSLL